MLFFQGGIDFAAECGYYLIIMKIASLMLILGFLSVALFGFSAMDFDGGHSSHAAGQGKCFATAVNGGTCPDETNGVTMEFFHANTYKNFSNVIIGGQISQLLAFFLAIIAVFLIWRIFISAPLPRFQHFSQIELPLVISKMRHYEWIELLQKRADKPF